MKKKWIETRKSGDFSAIAEKFQISPVIARIIRNRGIVGTENIEKYLNGGYEDLYSPHLMKDVDLGVSIIKSKIQAKKKIRIIGDYDIDGVFSTYILYRGLLRCGADVSYAIPHRIEDGYGINMHLIDAAHQDGVDTIITCDNGISAIDAITYAKNLNMTVIITDHHDIPYEETEEIRTYRLPPADAVVNPKQEDCLYPFKGLCGAAVAYKFVQVLYEAFTISENESKLLIEYAGFATIGDVMDLTDENRILVKLGLHMLRYTSNFGLKALCEVNNLVQGEISTYHVGFVLGPCVNATGRLETAENALRLLLASTEQEAKEIADMLYMLNQERKDMTQEGVDAAIEQIEAGKHLSEKVLVVYLPDCHESIAGIIAGKIREKYYRPTFVLTNAKDGVKGSGRSIEEYSMYDELVKCKDLLDKFGGHPMAAGISLQERNIEAFRKRLNENCLLSNDDLTEKVKIDAILPVEYISKDLVSQMHLLEPCGKGNTKPVFAARSVAVTGLKVLGQKRNAVKLNIKQANGLFIEGMIFCDADTFLADLENRFGTIEKDALLAGRAAHCRLNILYYPKINEWNGKETLQSVITDWC